MPIEAPRARRTAGSDREPTFHLALKRFRLAELLGIGAGELLDPVAAETNVGQLVGEDEIDGLLHDRIVRRLRVVDHRPEGIARESFEAPVDPGDPQGRIVGARRLEERGRLRVVAYLDAHVLEQLFKDLAVPGLVPALAGHVHSEFPRCVREVPKGAPRSFERLQLADEDAVQAHLELYLHVGILGMQRTELREKGVAGTKVVVDLLELRALHTIAKLGSNMLQKRNHPFHVVGQRFEEPTAGGRSLEAAVTRQLLV